MNKTNTNTNTSTSVISFKLICEILSNNTWFF